MPKVRRLHFVCANSRHVTDLPDGLFSTGFWKIGADAAQNAEFLALHQARKSHSYRQGVIVERHLVPYQEGLRYVFVVKSDSSSVAWEGEGSGEKGYGY